MSMRFARLTAPGAGRSPFIPDDPASDTGQSGGGSPAAAADPIVPDAPPSQPEMDSAGFPKGVSWRDMTAEQASNYWRAKAQSHEREKKSAFTERDALKADADAFRALDESTKSDELKQRERAERERDEALKQIEDQRRSFGSQLVETKLTAAAPGKGMTPEALNTLVGDSSRFLADGGVDDEALSAFLAALPDAKAQASAPMTPGSLGGGRRTEAKLSGLAAGADLYEQMHNKKRAPA